MPPQLPYELSDHIIDFLHDDKGALSSCSLTCQAWLPAARYHLFNHVTVAGRLQPFSLFLDSAEGVRPYVRSLRYDGGYYFRPCECTELRSILDRLPSLMRLHLERLDMNTPGFHELLDSHGYKELTNLTLVSLWIRSTTDLCRLVSSPSLRHLTIDNLEVSCDGDKTVIPPTLTSLSIGGSREDGTGFFDWLTKGPRARHIRKFQRTIRIEENVSHTKHMLQTLGDTVEEFEMLVDADTNLNAIFQDVEFSLSVLSNIRSCTLEFRIPEMFVVQNRSLAWITSLLCQLESPSLETVALHAKADSMEDLRALDSECGLRGHDTVSFEDYYALDWRKIESEVTKNRSLKYLLIQGRGRTDWFMYHIKWSYPRLYPFIRPCPL